MREGSFARVEEVFMVWRERDRERERERERGRQKEGHAHIHLFIARVSQQTMKQKSK